MSDIHYEFFKIEGGSPGVTVAFKKLPPWSDPSGKPYDWIPIAIGYAYCSPKDDFSETEGCRIAKDRLEQDHHWFDLHPEDPSVTRWILAGILLDVYFRMELYAREDSFRKACMREHYPIWMKKYYWKFVALYHIERWWSRWTSKEVHLG